MRAHKVTIALFCLAAALVPAAVAHGEVEVEPKPAWLLSATALPTAFPAGAEGDGFGGPAYLLLATNVGGAPAAGPVTITDTLPNGLSAANPSGCEVLGQVVTCVSPGTVPPGGSAQFEIPVNVDPLAPPSLKNVASVQGDGAEATITTTTAVSSSSASFGFLESFRVPVGEADGSATTLAGSHPYQLTASMGFPTEKSSVGLGGAGHVRDISVDFPPGLIADPTATPVLCTEAELTSEGFPGCPDSSQVGLVDVTTVSPNPQTVPAALYNMVPPPGMAASLGFDALGVGIFVHIGGSVRSDGDYGISGATDDTPALVNSPVFGAQVQLWGDPSAKSHEEERGACLKQGGSCHVAAQETALLTTAVHCSEQPEAFVGHADSWEHPGLFKEAKYQSAELDGTPASLSGCNQLDFKPSIEAKPTTTLTDSPSGLDFHLRQSQGDKKLKERAPTVLKDATVTLPEGLVVNPSSAAGQEACSSAQIGLITVIGQSPIHFSKQPARCSDASKIGTVEVTTPLLAQIDPVTNKVQRDPEGNVIPRPLHGSVYLAKPFDNPFDSLLAIYFSVEDPTSGTVAKFAGRVSADPVSGRLTTQVTEAPQLPLQDVRLQLFNGPRASLRTPPVCATQATTADLVPWASPAVLDAHESDSFATTAVPGGGPCPASVAAAPNNPSFVAGTLAPAAGAFSPLTMKLSREDATQPLAGFEATLPPGLSARLVGISSCSDAEIAQAMARSHPNEGALEQAAPSCPAGSEIGSLDVAAGAGPTPLHTSGHIYLAGPYKGAPLSVVTITPAIAGPFDLGVVAVRAALYIDPTTAQGRAVSDPLPTILDGIPLDVRSVTVKLDRSHFTLNPTSCDPKSVLAGATSVFGQVASLSTRFQVGGCKALPYKPKLTTRLFGPIHRGGHPRFRAVFIAKPGEANTKRIVLALPSSEFIDQAHFRTICTRVQFAANQCPPGSIYGHVKATTPLLGYPLEGPVYLRSSNHELPDAVAALKGPPSQPIEVDGVARIDSVNGGLRATVETVPDAPLTKIVLTQQGGKKGLFQNSTNICKGTHRATVKLDGQNGKAYDTMPLMKAQCPKKAPKKKGGKHHP
jgi:hypothetical protein